MDATTIEQARLGRRDAQAMLLRDLQDPWYRLCLSLLRDPEMARDATQESAVRFLQQLPGFRGESQLRTWALGIAINVVREMRRSTRRNSALDFPRLAAAQGVVDGPGNRASDLEERDRLRRLLDDLPDRQREAIVLRFFEEMSVEDAARAMECAPGTVKATVHQALRALRMRLVRSGG